MPDERYADSAVTAKSRLIRSKAPGAPDRARPLAVAGSRSARPARPATGVSAVRGQQAGSANSRAWLRGGRAGALRSSLRLELSLPEPACHRDVLPIVPTATLE